MSRVYLARIAPHGLEVADVVRAFDWLHWEALLPAGARVFVKPNLTWPEHLPGVTTTPRAIDAVVAALRQRTSNIVIGESDGGYHSYRAEEAFRGHDLYAIGERHGARIVNLSREPVSDTVVTVAGRSVPLTLPSLLLHETDLFVSLPVPKVHVMTGVSLGFKNQWGCLPSPMRLRNHPQFDHMILAINRCLRPGLVVFDGTYFLDLAGPMSGEAVKMDLLIAGDGPGAASAVCCAVMGIDPATVRHFKLARRAGMFPASLDEVQVNAPLQAFASRRFVMRRALLDWISLLGFRSRLLGRLFWDSAAAGPLHTLLYAVRRSPLVCRALYGPAGSPPEWDSRAG